jgi:hypothetical protein
MPVASDGTVIGIDIVGSADDFLASANKVQVQMDRMQTLSQKTGLSTSALAQAQKASFAATTQAAKPATMSWTDFRSAYQTMLDVVRVGQQVWAATGAEFIKYANEVTQVKRSLGTTSEEASRLIQIGGSVGITFDRMSASMNTAQKKGFDPNIEGLKKLSTAYLKLSSPTEKAQFLLKNFGKSGLEMGKLMEKGADGIGKLNDSISDNLILSESARQAAEDYTISTGELKDAWDGFVMQTAPAVVSWLTKIVNDERDTIRAREMLSDAGKNWLTVSGEEWQAAKDGAAAEREKDDAAKRLTQSTMDLTGATEDNAGALAGQKEAVEIANKAFDDYKKMLDDVSQANQDAEGFIQSYADFQKGYVKDHAEGVDKIREAEEKLADVMANKKGKGRDEAIAEATAGIEEAKKGVQELEATWSEATNKMIYDMMLAKVSVDGLTNAEFKATQDIAVQMGIRTQAQADEAKAMMDKAQALADGVALQEDVMREKAQTDANLLQLENDKKAAADGTTAAIVSGATVGTAALDGMSVSINNNITAMNNLGYSAATTSSIISKMAVGYGVAGGMQGPASPYRAPVRQSAKPTAGTRDNGGPGIAGQAYMIGPSAQPEMFVPNTNGTFIPNADKKGMGTTYNIQITNAKPESAENSIRKALKSLSYAGVVA